MEKNELDSSLTAIVERFYTPKPAGILGSHGPPFDVSKPNFHDNKQDFLAEMSAVTNGLGNVDGLLELLAAGFVKGEVSADVGERLTNFIDTEARLESRNYSTESGHDLVRRNSSELSLTHCLVYQLTDLRRGLRTRKVELMDQETEFWSGKSRPPNHFARTIALRFARLIARNTQQKPTFGTSRDGGHPSTDFGRALEEIFKLLRIKANVKNAATWAVNQLTEADVQPPHANVLGTIYGNPFPEGLGAFRPDADLKEILKKDPSP